MPMLGSGDAKSNALNQLDAAASGAGAAAGTAISPYRIPVRTGGVTQTEGRRTVGGRSKDTGGVNAGLYGDAGETPEVMHLPLNDQGMQAAIGAWYGFTDEKRSDLMKKMWLLGLTKSPTDFDGAVSVWQKAVNHAASFAQQGREIDPQDVLGMMADGSGGANGKGGYRQQATTNRAIDLTDPATAREWVQQAFHQSMGRKAEDAEVRALVDALHEKQQADPRVTTNTPTKWDQNGNALDSTTTTTGGVDPNSFFANRMANDPEANAHQAAADLFPALMQALGAGA